MPQHDRLPLPLRQGRQRRVQRQRTVRLDQPGDNAGRRPVLRLGHLVQPDAGATCAAGRCRGSTPPGRARSTPSPRPAATPARSATAAASPPAPRPRPRSGRPACGPQSRTLAVSGRSVSAARRRPDRHWHKGPASASSGTSKAHRRASSSPKSSLLPRSCQACAPGQAGRADRHAVVIAAELSCRRPSRIACGARAAPSPAPRRPCMLSCHLRAHRIDLSSSRRRHRPHPAARTSSRHRTHGQLLDRQQPVTIDVQLATSASSRGHVATLRSSVHVLRCQFLDTQLAVLVGICRRSGHCGPS